MAITETGTVGGASGSVTSFTFAPAAGAANVCDVVVTAKNAAGATLAQPVVFDIWLSDAATGAGLTGTSTSGTVTAKSASGVVLITGTAKKHLQVQALATGIFTLEITDTAKTAFYVCCKAGNGTVVVSTVLATANYG